MGDFMKALFVFALLFAGLSPAAYGSEGPCAGKARALFRTATGKAPSQFTLSRQSYNAWAGSQEYVYLAANGMGSAYVIELFHLEGHACFLNSMRFDGDL